MSLSPWVSLSISLPIATVRPSCPSVGSPALALGCGQYATLPLLLFACHRAGLVSVHPTNFDNHEYLPVILNCKNCHDLDSLHAPGLVWCPGFYCLKPAPRVWERAGSGLGECG